MKVYIVRHGQTTGDLEDRYGGDYDDHLSKEGIKQASKLASKLQKYKIKLIYNSPRIRAVETANIIAKKLNVPLVEVQDLRERNAYGVLTGMIKSEALQKYPSEVEKLNKSKTFHRVSGSEDYSSFKNRITKAIEKIIQSDKHDAIAIITHGGPISCFIREILKLGEVKTMSDCSIVELEKKDGKLNLLKFDGITLV